MDTEYTSPIIEEFDDPTDTFKDNEFVYTYARSRRSSRNNLWGSFDRDGSA